MDSNAKKLTLEERLSQAAQKGKRRTKKQNATSSTTSPAPGELVEVKNGEIDGSFIKSQLDTTDGAQDKEVKDVTSGADAPTIECNGAPKAKKDQDILLSILHTEPWSSWISPNGRPLEPVELLKQLEPHVNELIKQNASVAKPDASASSLVKVIKEKEDIIGQLRLEGEKLSKTELKQNTTINALNRKVGELEEEIEILQKDLIEKLEKLEELSLDKEDLLTKIRSSETQIKDLSEDKVEVDSLKAQIAEKESQIKELRVSIEKREKNFNNIETKLRNEMDSLRSTSREEITSLESNLERLRIELEISTKAAEKSAPDDHLQEQNKFLRAELQSNRENWNTLEDALNGKISALEARVSQAEKAKRNLMDELSLAMKTNESLQEKIKDASELRISNQKTIEELENKNKALSASLEDVKDDFQLLQRQYNLQKSHLEHRIDSTESLSKKVSALGPVDQVTDPVKFDDEWLLPSMISPMDDSGSTMDLKEKLANEGFESIHGSPKSEKTDLDLEISDIPNEASELRSLPRAGISRQHSSSNNIHRLGSEVPISNQMSAQMVSKLAAEIRRFEVEVSSLKGQCDRVQKEKNSANNEIVRLLEENERLKTLENEKLDLSKEVQDLQSKLETSLQLLGEKTERAEELENDVQDLKDMMKQQIQDMVELQNKSL